MSPYFCIILIFFPVFCIEFRPPALVAGCYPIPAYTPHVIGHTASPVHPVPSAVLHTSHGQEDVYSTNFQGNTEVYTYQQQPYVDQSIVFYPPANGVQTNRVHYQQGNIQQQQVQAKIIIAPEIVDSSGDGYTSDQYSTMNNTENGFAGKPHLSSPAYELIPAVGNNVTHQPLSPTLPVENGHQHAEDLQHRNVAPVVNSLNGTHEQAINLVPQTRPPPIHPVARDRSHLVPHRVYRPDVRPLTSTMSQLSLSAPRLPPPSAIARGGTFSSARHEFSNRGNVGIRGAVPASFTVNGPTFNKNKIRPYPNENTVSSWENMSRRNNKNYLTNSKGKNPIKPLSQSANGKANVSPSNSTSVKTETSISRMPNHSTGGYRDPATILESTTTSTTDGRDEAVITQGKKHKAEESGLDAEQPQNSGECSIVFLY